MADERVKDLTTTATQHASDDYFDLDGSTNGSRKILASKYAHVDLNSAPVGGYILDGTNDYITVSDDDNLDLGTGDFTLETYFKTGSDVSTSQEIIAKRLGALGNGFEIYVESGVLKFRKLSSSDQATISYPISANTLYHFLITKSDSTYSMYINGVQVSYTGSISLTNTLSNSENLIIGKLSGGGYFKGQIYYIRVYTRTLSASEVVKLWDNGKPESSQLPYIDRNGGQSYLLGTWLNGFTTSFDAFTPSGTSGFIATNTTNESPRVKCSVLPIAYGETFQIDFDITFANCTVAPYLISAYYSGISGSVFESATSGHNTVTFTHTYGGYNIDSLGFIVSGLDTNIEVTVENFVMKKLGCVAEYLPENAGKFGWLETQNRLHGSTSGSPIAASAGLFENYKDAKLSVTGNSILTDVVPKEYKLKGILFNNTTANTVVINVGTSSGATDVVNAQSVPAGLTFVSLAKIFSLTADQTLYVSSSAWNSASVNVELSMSKY